MESRGSFADGARRQVRASHRRACVCARVCGVCVLVYAYVLMCTHVYIWRECMCAHVCVTMCTCICVWCEHVSGFFVQS